MQWIIGIAALVLALPSAFNALVSLYDRFFAKPGAKPAAISAASGRWTLRFSNVIGLCLLGVIIARTWFVSPSGDVGAITEQPIHSQTSSVGTQKSPFLHLDDTRRWQFIKQWIDTAIDDHSSRLHCSAVMGVQRGQKALDLNLEFYPLIYYSGWDATQGVLIEQNEPFGITILTGGKNQDAFLCGSKLSRMLQNLSSDVPIIFRNDQVTDNLIKCNYTCVQIEVAGGLI